MALLNPIMKHAAYSAKILQTSNILLFSIWKRDLLNGNLLIDELLCLWNKENSNQILIYIHHNKLFFTCHWVCLFIGIVIFQSLCIPKGNSLFSRISVVHSSTHCEVFTNYIWSINTCINEMYLSHDSLRKASIAKREMFNFTLKFTKRQFLYQNVSLSRFCKLRQPFSIKCFQMSVGITHSRR